ncbi:phage tail protein I [Hartmannibacter diazotrophicus]|uniref:Phage tail protein I n=1 Tax=Hartmannibacter diazotrophicus TaxID=1482074 RepID=A0A2C9D6K1_9HYPH|nr:phage tail protein I [Hartmannibacter diazotrophicus]SON55820.1 phage tail protein I [Hartmannibacter diazotrophicus]
MTEASRTANADLILPASATKLERALVALALRIGEIPLPLPDAKDPARTALALLPHLAWERSVDVWDPDWPETVQRAVVAAAYEVHRRKGTRGAIEAALAALSVDVDIVEWFDMAPMGEPYSFAVTAYARTNLYQDAPLLDARTIASIDQTIRRTKPASRPYRLAVGALAEGSIGVSGTATAELRGRLDARAAFRPKRTITLGLAATSTVQIHVRLDMRAT